MYDLQEYINRRKRCYELFQVDERVDRAQSS